MKTFRSVAVVALALLLPLGAAACSAGGSDDAKGDDTSGPSDRSTPAKVDPELLDQLAAVVVKNSSGTMSEAGGRCMAQLYAEVGVSEAGLRTMVETGVTSSAEAGDIGLSRADQAALTSLVANPGYGRCLDAGG